MSRLDTTELHRQLEQRGTSQPAFHAFATVNQIAPRRGPLAGRSSARAAGATNALVGPSWPLAASPFGLSTTTTTAAPSAGTNGLIIPAWSSYAAGTAGLLGIRAQVVPAYEGQVTTGVQLTLAAYWRSPSGSGAYTLISSQAREGSGASFWGFPSAAASGSAAVEVVPQVTAIAGLPSGASVVFVAAAIGQCAPPPGF